MTNRFARSGRRRSRGQALVEFSLVFMIFMTIFSGVIEFGIAFSVRQQLSFMSRDAATMASESGGTPATADGAILAMVDRDIMAPVNKNKIVAVEIFWADTDGSVKNGAVERYTPGGPLFPGKGGWSRAQDSYPPANRCSFIGGVAAGCATGHTGPDRVGVRVIYNYGWVTPLPSLIGLTGSGMTFSMTNLVQMEPIPVV